MPLLANARGRELGWGHEAGRQILSHIVNELPDLLDAWEVMSLEAVAFALGIVSIALAIVTILLAVRLYKLQTKQGRRIAVSVISTTDQIYRRLRDRGFGQSVEEVDMDEHDVFRASCSPRWMKAGEQTTLSLDWHVENPPSDFAEITCVVDRPSGEQDKVSRLLTAEDLVRRLAYPSDDFPGSTSEPGRYHVRWRGRLYWLVEEDATGKERQQDCWLGSAEDSFGVLP